MKRQKRMKKHHLKRWSSSIVNGYYGAKKYEIADAMRSSGYRECAKSLAVHNTDKFISLFITKPRQQSIDRAKIEVFKNRLEEFVSISQMERQIVLRNTVEEHLSLVYGHTGCILVQSDNNGTIKRSVLYPSSVVAIDRVKDHRIIWVETIHATPPPACT
jgi:hypothetical protein